MEYGNRLTIGFHMLADFTANLQVFCRQKSGNGCPVYVCLFPVRGACGLLQRVEAQLKRLPDLGKWFVDIVPLD